MAQHSPIEAGLPTHLFWDVNLSTLDFTKHADLIVERVIERGSYKDLQLIEKHYSNDQLDGIIKNIAYLHPRGISFVHYHFQIPLNQLKCYTKKPLTRHYLD